MYKNREENAREKKAIYNPIIPRRLLMSGIIFFCSCYIPQEDSLALSKFTSEKQPKTNTPQTGAYFFKRDKNLKYNMVPVVILTRALSRTLGIQK